jgi:transcription elongation factor GreA
MQKMFKLTAESLEKLQDELNWLRTVREKEVAEQIKEARAFGDLSENCEYDEAKNEQGKVYSRIAELENIIAHTVIIETTHDAGVVGAGCRVTVLDLDENVEEEYAIVGSQEANPAQARISDESPFGRALCGKSAGHEIEVEVPAGMLRYKILKVE